MFSQYWLRQWMLPQKQAAELLPHDHSMHSDEVVSHYPIEQTTSDEHMIIECELVSGVKHNTW